MALEERAQIATDEPVQDIVEEAEGAPPGSNVAAVVSRKDEEEVEVAREVAEDDSEPEVDDDLKDAVEGAMRLKRLLSSGSDGLVEPAMKRRRTLVRSTRSPQQDARCRQLLIRWGMLDDALIKHVLETLSLAELDSLVETRYAPQQSNQWKSPAELLLTHVNQQRENRYPGGGCLNVVSCFVWRWGFDIASDEYLRGLKHKELRFVLNNYDGTRSLDEVLTTAANAECSDEFIAAAPNAPGVEAMSRYTRLELIDPVADCAVFGDANLTFSLNLARQRRALGHVGRVVATTFENLETLKERYKEIGTTIKELEAHYAEVYHTIDCTRIALEPRLIPLRGSLGAVYYNFPHAGAVAGFFDGHPVVNWRHENLMRLFFRALRSFVQPGGSVKVSSNTLAVGVRFSYILDSAAENEFVHVETLPFLEWCLHRYGRSYGDRRDSYKRPGDGEQYNAQRADSDMVYCFKYQPSGQVLPEQQIRLPPTYKTLIGCVDGPLGERTGAEKQRFATLLYKRFLAECSGTHVG